MPGAIVAPYCWSNHSYDCRTGPYKKHGTTTPDFVCAVQAGCDTDKLNYHGVDTNFEDIIDSGLLVKVGLGATLDDARRAVHRGNRGLTP